MSAAEQSSMPPQEHISLVSLNTWGGQLFGPLIDFFRSQAAKVDVFCLQEILSSSATRTLPVSGARANLFSELARILPEFTAFYRPAPREARYFQDDLLPTGVQVGQAIFIRNSIQVIEVGGFHTYAGSFPHGMFLSGRLTGQCQWIRIRNSVGPTLICNMHGLWQRDTNKADTPARIQQSEIIRRFLLNQADRVIMCGDFNLDLGTVSLASIAEGFRNLVEEYGITSTRTHYYQKHIRHADYCFVSPGITVEEFAVLPDIISDHFSLMLHYS